VRTAEMLTISRWSGMVKDQRLTMLGSNCWRELAEVFKLKEASEMARLGEKTPKMDNEEQ